MATQALGSLYSSLDGWLGMSSCCEVPQAVQIDAECLEVMSLSLCTSTMTGLACHLVSCFDLHF